MSAFGIIRDRLLRFSIGGRYRNLEAFLWLYALMTIRIIPAPAGFFRPAGVARLIRETAGVASVVLSAL